MKKSTKPHRQKPPTSIKWAGAFVAGAALTFIGITIWNNALIPVAPEGPAEPPNLSAKYNQEALPYYHPEIKSLPIILPNATLDPTQHEPLLASGFHNNYIGQSGRLYIVQYRTTKDINHFMDTMPEMRLDEYTYVMPLTIEQIAILKADPDVNFIEHYHPHYKAAPELIRAYYDVTVEPYQRYRVYTSSKPTADTIIASLKESVGDVTITPQPPKDGQSVYLMSGLSERGALFPLLINSWVLAVYPE